MVATLTLATGTASRDVRDHARSIAADTRGAEDASGAVVGERTAVNFPFTATLETGFGHS